MSEAQGPGSARPIMAIETAVVDDVVLVTVHGEVDLSSSPDLAERLDAVLDASPGTAVVLDLTQVQFIGSSGLAVLATRADHAHHAAPDNPRIRLVAGTNHRVIRPFSATGLDRHAPLYPSVAAAIRAIRGDMEPPADQSPP